MRALEQLQRQSVEGVLINAAQERITQELDHRVMDVPVVAVEDTTEAGVPVVAVDQAAGAAAATQLLLDLGHRTVSHIAGASDWSAARRRARGMARDAGVGRGSGAASAHRRLEPAIGL